jgi:hypothetical protein
VLITAGPTFEAIDPVRGITNRSSGKMGFAIARAAREAGARSRWWPARCPAHAARRAPHRRGFGAICTAMEHAQDANIFIATAAVADWRPATQAEQKIKKDGSGVVPRWTSSRTPTSWPRWRTARAQAGELYCVGFAAESETCWPTPRPSARARACRCWWATSARPPSARTTTRCCWSMTKGHRAAARQQARAGAAAGGRDRAARVGVVGMKIDVRMLDERLRAQPPAYATPGSAGLDLRACLQAPLVLAPGACQLVPTGLAVHLADPGYAR